MINTITKYITYLISNHWQAIALIIALIGFFRIYLFIKKTFPRYQQRFLFLINRNNGWTLLIIAFNLISYVLIWPSYKAMSNFPNLYFILATISVVAFLLYLYNFGIVSFLYLQFYKEEQSNIVAKKYQKNELFWSMVIAYWLVFFVVMYYHFRDLLPSWFVKGVEFIDWFIGE